MMPISFVTAVEEMKFSRGMKRARSLHYKHTRKDRRAISKDNTIGKKLMERDSQRHMTQEKHHEITIQTKMEAPPPTISTIKLTTPPSVGCECECCSCSC